MLEPSPLVSTAVDWFLTYTLHSTILIAGAWLAAPAIARWSERGRDVLWKFALTGALVSASVQVGFGISPLSGALEVDTGIAETSAPVAAPTDVGPSGVRRHVIMTDSRTYTFVSESPEATAAGAVSAPAKADPDPPMWPWALLGVWGVGASLCLIGLGSRLLRLRRELKDRSEVLDDPVLESFLELCQSASIRRKVRLTATESIAAPTALWRSEICLPQRAIRELNPRQVHGVLAHELAHLERRDPQWSLLSAVIEAIFCLQPLNRIARRKMQESAEFLCDDWAVRHTGTGEHLASSLATVASWRGGVEAMPLGPAVVRRGRPFVRRVERLLDAKRDRSADDGGAARVGAVLAGLAVVSWAAPGVASARTVTDEPQQDPPTPRVIVAERIPEEVVAPTPPAPPSHDCRGRCGHRHIHIDRHHHHRDTPGDVLVRPNGFELRIDGFGDGGHFGSGMQFWSWSEGLGDVFGGFDIDVHIDLDEESIGADHFEAREERERERAERVQERARERQERARERAQQKYEREKLRLERELAHAAEALERLRDRRDDWDD